MIHDCTIIFSHYFLIKRKIMKIIIIIISYYLTWYLGILTTDDGTPLLDVAATVQIMSASDETMSTSEIGAARSRVAKAERRALYRERSQAAAASAAEALRNKLTNSVTMMLHQGDNDADGLLDLNSLGSARPSIGETRHGTDVGASAKPFCCEVYLEIRGQTVEQGIEQGRAVIREVQSSFERGPVCVSNRQAAHARSCVMWQNLGAASLRLDPSKSNRINWLDKAWATPSARGYWESTWAAQREMLRTELSHAASWVAVLEAAYEDGGMDIKDDCRLGDGSALCHQDGGNAIMRLDGLQPLVRLAVNASTPQSARSLDYLEMGSEGRLVDGDERRALLVHSVSQHEMWHGVAQTIHGYVKGVSSCCHSSSAGQGPCLKRIITVFELPKGHALEPLSALQRLRRVGITVRAVDPCHRQSEARRATSA